MSDKDYIKELFSEKLGNYEAKVDPSLWGNIASQVATGTAATTSTGLSLVTKWIIGISVASVVTVTTLVIVSNDGTNTEKVQITENESIVSNEESVEKQKEATVTVAPTSENNSTSNQNEVSPAPTQFEEPIINEQHREEVVNPSTTEKTIEKETTTKKVVAENENNVVEKETEPIKETEEKTPIVEPVIEENETAYSIEELSNIFTPNGDGNNDFLLVKSEGLEDFSVVVLDANGKTMFKSQDPSFKWDGTDLSGNPAPDGRYVYYITARDKNGAPINKYSPLTIRR